MAAPLQRPLFRALADGLSAGRWRSSRARRFPTARHRLLIRYLVDTNVLSAGSSAARQRDHAGLVDWMDQNSARLFLPSIAVAEVSSGIAKLNREGAIRRAAALGDWLAETLHLYAGRTLGVGVAEARIIGAMLDRSRAEGLGAGWADVAIAGTARANELTVLTRNLRHFAPLDVPAHDPYASLPE